VTITKSLVIKTVAIGIVKTCVNSFETESGNPAFIKTVTSSVFLLCLHGCVDVLDEEGDELAHQPRVDGRPHVVRVLGPRRPVDAHHVAVLLKIKKQKIYFDNFIFHF
jgi:hypothetical protein